MPQKLTILNQGYTKHHFSRCYGGMNIWNDIQVPTAVNVKVTFYLNDGGGKFLRNVGT
jgi:hypothetical protein